MKTLSEDPGQTMAHEILNIKIKDIIFKVTEEDTEFAEVFIAGGYASVCYIQEINILPKTHTPLKVSLSF